MSKSYTLSPKVHMLAEEIMWYFSYCYLGPEQVPVTQQKDFELHSVV